jgi:hypothetical protein
MFFCLGCPLDLLIAGVETRGYHQNTCEYRLTYGPDERLTSYQCYAHLKRRDLYECPSDCVEDKASSVALQQ